MYTYKTKGTCSSFINFRMDVEDSVNSAVGGYEGSGTTQADKDARQMWVDIVKKIAKVVDQFLPVAMIVLGLVAVVYCIVLGVKYSSSESDDAKNEVKKKLINSIIGFTIGLVIMIVLLVFLKNVPAVAQWINETGTVK